MTANKIYQFGKATLEILERINASKSFIKGIKSVISSEFTGIFENQLTNALAIAESLLNRNVVYIESTHWKKASLIRRAWRW